MDRYYGTIRDVVEAHGGRIVKFIGDGVMAVFGVPDTGEEDVRRALDATLAMHAAFATVADEVERDHGVRMALRIGVNTGEVVVSLSDDDVVGDAVNVASRLEKAADNGAVLVGEATWRAARGYAVFDALPPLAMAGKAAPVRTYRLVAIEDAPEPRTEFVGRSRELDVLTDALEAVVRDGCARLATVLGPPGLGKTRLATEFERRIATRATVLAVRCPPGGASTLSPVADLVRTATGIDETADAAEIGVAVGSLLAADDPDHERIVERAVAILGAGSSGTPEETLWAVRRLVENVARTGPAVVVIDDLQWAERMLTDLVLHLAEWTRAPLLLLVLARPELRDICESLTDGSRHTVIALEGLDRDSTAQLASDLLDTDAVPPGLLEHLPDYTGGNPLFLRELLRMLVDDGTVVATGGGWKLTVAPDAMDVPPTIQALLAARIDRLPADEQLLLERASIAGKEFPLGALRDLVPIASDAAVDRLLESLRRKELIEPDVSYWIDEPVYRFHHVLIRDAAYRRVLRQTRAELHERLARWLEHKVGLLIGEHEELVGYHLERAYAERRELGGHDGQAQEVGREASDCLGRAATNALDRDDLPAAAALAARALTCLGSDDSGRAGILLVRCEALLAMGDAAAAAGAVSELGQVAAESPRLVAWHSCFDSQLMNLTDPSALVDTERRVADVAAVLTALGDTRGAAKAHTVHASTLARLGRFADVEVALDLALSRARESGDRRLARVALAAAPLAAVWGPSPVPRAGGRCLDVVRLLRITASSRAVEATSQRCQAVLEAFRGRIDPARRLIGVARATLEELGLVHGLLETELFAGIVELVAGDLDAADRSLRTAHDGLHALGAEADAARAAALLARVCVARDAFDEADDLAAEAERLAGDDLHTAIAWRGARAAILAQRGDHAAHSVADEAIAIAGRTDALVGHADALFARATVRHTLGDDLGAASDALHAAELYGRKGATLLATVAQALVGVPPTAGAAGTLRRGHSEPANRCTDAFRRAEAADDQYAYVDHRRVERNAEFGSSAHVDTMRVLTGQGATTTVMSVLATRGELLALIEIADSAPNDPDGHVASRTLAVVGITGVGRLALMSVYDLDDLDTATHELDDRYLAGEGSPYADIVRIAIESAHAYNARAWDRFHGLHTPDVLAVDHRPAGWGTLHGAEAQVEFFSQLIAMVPNLHMTIETFVGVARDRILYSAGVDGLDTSGGVVELSFVVLNRFDGAHIREMEIFPIEALDSALAAFHGTNAALRNAATDVTERFGRLVVQQDWDALRALLAPDYANVDHRRLVSQNVDTDEMIEAMIDSVALGVSRAEYVPIAVRGDRLWLARCTYAGSESPAFEVTFLAIDEVDSDGRLASSATFDVDDLGTALNELERRYIAAEGAPYAEHIELLSETIDAYNRRDWTSYRSQYTDDFVFVDHRPATLGIIRGADEFIDSLRAIFDVLPGLNLIAAAVYPRSHGLVTYCRAISMNDDGSSTELAFHAVAVTRDGRVVRQEHFPVEALEQAIRALEALGTAAPPVVVLENSCTRAVERNREARLRGDWDTLADVLDADFVHEDRRRGLGTRLEGRAANVDHARVVNEIAHVAPASRCLAVRGDRLALLHVALGHDDPSSLAADMLWVAQIDDQSRLLRSVVFDADAIDAAIAELDRTYLSDLTIEHAGVLQSLFGAVADYNMRDWTAYMGRFHPEAVTVDHRVTGWGATDGHQGMTNARAMLELIPDMHAVCANIVITTPDGLVVTNRFTGTSPQGTPVEFLRHVVAVSRQDLIAHMELFPDDALDAALARLAELASA